MRGDSVAPDPRRRVRRLNSALAGRYVVERQLGSASPDLVFRRESALHHSIFRVAGRPPSPQRPSWFYGVPGTESRAAIIVGERTSIGEFLKSFSLRDTT